MIIHCWSLASFNIRRPSIFVDFSSNFCTAFLKLFRRRFEAVVWQFSKLPHLRCRVRPPQNLGGRFTVWHHLCSRPQQLPFFLFELRFQIFHVPVFCIVPLLALGMPAYWLLTQNLEVSLQPCVASVLSI